MKQLNSMAVTLLAASTFAIATLSQAAPITLTQAGIDNGFSLARIATGFQGSIVLGSAVNSNGKIVVGDGFGNGKNYVLNDVNNQTLGDAISSTPTGVYTYAIVNSGGTLYGGGLGNGLKKLNNDGTIAQNYGIAISAGMWVNPVNQHIIAVGGSGLVDIDVSGPVPSVRQINGAFSDGITVSPDGQFVYTNSAAYRIDTGALVASYSVSGADGMAVISSSNALNGKVIVGTTNGNLVMLDPSNSFSQTVIANGGGYTDFFGVDQTNGSLMFGQPFELWRMGCGVGCGIGVEPPPPPVGNVPEPGTALIFGLGMLALTGARRRKQ